MRELNHDAARLGDLYRETNVDVLAFLLRRCPTAEDAADCLAETYLIAWEKRDQVPAGSDARLWLFGVARNVMRRGHERSRRVASTTRSLATQLQEAGSAQLTQPHEENKHAIAALSQLSELDREIITMISWDGLTPREVGQVLGLSANIVRVRAHRARATLRSLLATSDSSIRLRTAHASKPAQRTAMQEAGG